MSLLSLQDVNVFYDQIHAVKDISFHVDPGEIVSLIGANGAGKTTTLHTISGLLKPKSGAILFKGKDLTSLKPQQIVECGLAQVLEGRHVFSELSVHDNLHLGGYLYPFDQKSQDLLQQIYQYFPILYDRRHQLAQTLSGGQQQMLAIGRALMSRPELLILDEPSMGLSPLYVKTVFDLLVALNKEGLTILLVEQNANKALTIADRAYVLETGKIILSGTGQDLLNNPRVKKAYLGI